MKILITSAVSAAMVAVAAAGSVGSGVAPASAAVAATARPPAPALPAKPSVAQKLSAPLRRVGAGTIYYDVKTATVQGCYMALDVSYGGGDRFYVRARFYAHQVSCTGALYRRSGSRSYGRISGEHFFDPDPTPPEQRWVYTGWYWDGPGYQAKVCADSDTLVGKCTDPY